MEPERNLTDPERETMSPDLEGLATPQAAQWSLREKSSETLLPEQNMDRKNGDLWGKMTMRLVT